MICETILKGTLIRLGHAACAFGVLISLATLPALGQQIHQLSYNGSTWADKNLDGAPTEWGISSFFTTPNDQLHVFYDAAESGDLHQLFYNGSNWADSTLSQSAGVNASSGISGFSVENYQYVYYIGRDDGVHQMLYDNAGWVDTELTDASGATTFPLSNLVALTTTPALHVYYTDIISHVHQLFATNGTNWQDQDLTATTGGPLACQCYDMAGFNVGNFQYVYYTDLTNHVHQLFYNNASWTDEDLTALTKSSPATTNWSNLSAFVIPGTKKMRVYFVSGTNGHLMQLASTNNGKWSSSDLTKKAKGFQVPGQIVAFPDSTGGKVNVFYVAGSGDLNRIYQPTTTTWANEDLTALTEGGSTYSQYPLAGFSLNNNLYLYYAGD